LRPDYRNTPRTIRHHASPRPKLIHYEAILPERSHNEYLQILAELGTVGFLLFAWLLFGIIKLLFGLRRKSVSLLGACLICRHDGCSFKFGGQLVFVPRARKRRLLFLPARLFVKEFGKSTQSAIAENEFAPD